MGFKNKIQTVEQLDCDTSAPLPVHENEVIIRCFATDICTAQLNGEKVLVATSSEAGVLIGSEGEPKIDRKTNQLDIIMKSRSITADRDGNVFVCDYNNECVHRFNKYDHMGVLLKAGDHGLGKPVMIRWCNSMPYLIVAHIINEKLCVSMVKVD